MGEAGTIPGLGRSLGGGHGNPLQCSCLENPTDTAAWRATVQEVAELDMTEETEQACTQASVLLICEMSIMIKLTGFL